MASGAIGGQQMAPGVLRQNQLGGVPSLEDVRRVLSRSDKSRSPTSDAQGLLVTACGRTITVPESPGGTALLLQHVQKSLQDELGLPDQAFDLNDRTGLRLRTDQDLREAVVAGRIPLNAKFSDTTAKIASIQSDIKWVCQQIGSMRGELESQKQEHTTDVETLRTELYSSLNSVLEATKLAGTPASTMGHEGLKLDLTTGAQADQGIPLASMEHFANLENDIRHVEAKLDEMSLHFRNTMSEYSRHHDKSSSQNSDAIARLVERCAGLDQRVANVEMGMASVGVRPKTRDGQFNQSPPTSVPPHNRNIHGVPDMSGSFTRNQSPNPSVPDSGAFKVDMRGPDQGQGGQGGHNRFSEQGAFSRNSPNLSPAHSPEPSVHSMAGGLDRNPMHRTSAIGTRPRSPSQNLGIGGGFPGPGRPGGPSGGGQSFGQNREGGFGGNRGVSESRNEHNLPGDPRAFAGGPGSALGMLRGNLDGSGQYPAVGAGAGVAGRSEAAVAGAGLRTNSPRFPKDKSTGSGQVGSGSLGSAGVGSGTVPRQAGPGSGLVPRASRPTSAAVSESGSQGNVLRRPSNQADQTPTGASQAGSVNISGGTPQQPAGSSVRMGGQSQYAHGNPSANMSLSGASGNSINQLGKMMMPNA